MAGYMNIAKPRRLDDYSLALNFCHAKATWDEGCSRLFQQCRLAFETSIMPKKGSLSDQDASFAEVFPFFVERWVYRKEHQFWTNVSGLASKMVEAIGTMLGAKPRG